MFILIIFAVLFLWLGVAIFLERTSGDYEFSITFSTILIVIFGLYLGISGLSVYTNQVRDIEKLAIIEEYNKRLSIKL